MVPAWLLPVLLAALSAALVAAAVSSLRRRAFGAGMAVAAAALTLAALALASGAVAWTLAQYQALSREVTAATVRLTPTGPQRFEAHVTFTDGRAARTFALAGDQIWLDAQIVKWHPAANLVGLHTAYRLERIGGRYRRLDDERTAPRTVAALGPDGPSRDLFAWIDDRPWLSPLVDASYGSASYVAADASATVQVRVSTTGLLIRSRPDE